MKVTFALLDDPVGVEARYAAIGASERSTCEWNGDVRSAEAGSASSRTGGSYISSSLIPDRRRRRKQNNANIPARSTTATEMAMPTIAPVEIEVLCRLSMPEQM